MAPLHMNLNVFPKMLLQPWRNSLYSHYFLIGIKCYLMFLSVGNAPKMVSKLEDVTVISPEVATFECEIKPGMDEFQVAWWVTTIWLMQMI